MSTQQRRACCAGAPPRIVYVKIRGHPVGMIGIEELFERLYEAGRRDDEALEDELVEQARIYNYIARGAEKDYGWALRQAYRFYVRSREKGDRREWLPFTRP
ncbi:MAG: hypothetical protein ACP5OO_06045 [Chloroflexia bacterium]